MEWFRTLREKSGFTQEKLEELSGVDRSMISKIETGSASPSLKTAKALADVLNFNWTRFFEPEQEAS